MKVWRSESESSADGPAPALGTDAVATGSGTATPAGVVAASAEGIEDAADGQAAGAVTDRVRVPVHSAHVRAAVEAAEAAGSGELIRRRAS